MKVFSAATLLCIAATATTVTGRVTNGTNQKPAAGDDVILLKLEQTMQEEGRTRSGSDGRFTLEVKESKAPHLIRVVHQGAPYHQALPPGTTSADVEVFDAAPKIDGIHLNAQVMRIQGQGPALEVIEMYAVQNSSTPPRTQAGERSFQVFLPAAAEVQSAIAAGPNGMAVNTSPVPVSGERGHYAFNFPLRPGETRFQISYSLPYSGQTNFQPILPYQADSLAVLLPKTMQFAPQNPAVFQSALEENGASVQVAKNVAAGSGPAFRISGTGSIPQDFSPPSSAENSAAGPAAASNRPGGGLGNPEGTPDPLENYRWYVLALLALLLAAGAFWVSSHSRRAALATGSAASSASLLSALKEELFALEAERAQGRISPEEYARAKSALDYTLQRALRKH